MDVTLIRAFVDLGFDGMSPQKRLPTKVGSAQYSETHLILILIMKGRVGTPLPKKDERKRKLLTFILGGFLGEQECSSRALCEIGKLLETVKGKSLVFM